MKNGFSRELFRRDDNLKTLLLVLFFAAFLTGIYLRCNHISDISFSGDEETTTLAAMGISENGIPHFPSGMDYYRSLPQTYLLHLVFSVFGVGELQARILSVILGILTILLMVYLSYLIYPDMKLALLVGIFTAFSAYHIEESRTARMYGPFIFTYVIYLIFAVRYFNHRKMTDLIGAVALFILSVSLHVIAIFGLFFLSFQFFTVEQKKYKVQIFWASAIAGIAWLLIYIGVETGFREFLVRNGAMISVGRSKPGFHLPTGNWYVLGINIAASIPVLYYVLKNHLKRVWWIFYPAALLFITGFVHLGWIVLFCYFLYENKLNRVLILLSVLGLFCTEAVLLNNYLVFGGIKEAVKQTFIYPYLTELYFLRNLPLFVITFGLFYYFTNTEKKQINKIIFWGAFTALVALSFFRYEFPIRYLVFLFPVMMYIYGFSLVRTIYAARGRLAKTSLALLGFILIIAEVFPPQYLGGYFNVAYGAPMITWEYSRPDHKGAVSYVKQHMDSSDVVIAVDALQTEYYLNRVDYWLRKWESTGQYIYLDKNQKYRDIYTDSRYIENLAQVDSLIHQNPVVWIIDSGETFASPGEDQLQKLRHYYLDDDVINFLDSSKSKIVYQGRDKLTNVYKFVNPKFSKSGTSTTVGIK